VTLEDLRFNATNTTNNSSLRNDTFGDPFPGISTFPPKTPPSDGTPSSARTPIELVRDVVIILLAGVGVILGLLIFTYVMAVFFDHFCCCLRRFRPVLEDGEIDNGRIARAAGLYGLTRDERMRILEQIFEKTTFSYNSTDANRSREKDVDSNPDDDDVEAQTTMTKKDAETTEKIENVNLETPPNAPYDGLSDPDAEIEDIEDEEEAEKNDADHMTTCCICLNAYKNGCQLMTGTRCLHRFHRDCILEWCRKHDGCPYCRKPMISPSEMLETAQVVLEPRRLATIHDDRVRNATTPRVSTVQMSSIANSNENSAEVQEEAGEEAATSRQP